jgi:predicted dehydrogenase
LAGIVARAPEAVARARADWPGTPIFASLTEMIAAGVCDAVTITTPPETRHTLALAAIAAGPHVIADKPFASRCGWRDGTGQGRKGKGRGAGRLLEPPL